MLPLLFAAMGLSTPWSASMLAAHNQVRAQVGLRPLEWSYSLAAKAQEWADTLIDNNWFFHSHTPGLGESMTLVINGEYVPQQVVAGWVSERRFYDLRRNQCADMCGHYTQVVWRDTKSVGCAMSRTDDRQVWVCEYYPPGNYVGQRPY
jgi:uncharacterized protein YkwD